ncbi:MAG: DUF3530 family protein [Methylobacter sp.]
MKRRYRIAVFLLALMLAGAAWAGDDKREAELADSIGRTLSLGKGIWLEAKGKKFFAVYTEIEKVYGHGVVIILHDMGGNPNQKPLIYGLRTLLPEHGWATLSLQMPIRGAAARQEDYYALFPEAAARIQAGIDYVKGNGAASIIVVGYGLGGLMGMYALSEQKLKIGALAAISLPVPKTGDKAAQTLDFIKKIKLPVLDIYGELDLPDVVDSARDRRLASKENLDYRQVVIHAENHAYQHDEDLLVKRIYGWLAVVMDAPAQ